MSGQRLRVGSKHSCKNLAIVSWPRHDKLWNCQGKRSPTIGRIGSGTSDGQRFTSRISRAIGKSGAGQSCLPRAQAAMFDLMDESKNKRARINSLKPFRRTIVTSMQASRASYKKQNVWGICGAVSEFELLKDYQTALEIALGANVTTDHCRGWKAATRAIDLKRNRLGRATFLH